MQYFPCCVCVHACVYFTSKFTRKLLNEISLQDLVHLAKSTCVLDKIATFVKVVPKKGLSKVIRQMGLRKVDITVKICTKSVRRGSA